MKLYEFSLAPGPRRVRIFIAEKGIEIPSVQINTRERQQFSDEYRAVNPNCVVPALVLNDGTCIGESVAICRYLEETHPRAQPDGPRCQGEGGHRDVEPAGGARGAISPPSTRCGTACPCSKAAGWPA